MSGGDRHVKEADHKISSIRKLDGASIEVAEQEKANVPSHMFNFVSGSFSPIIAAIAGDGMVKALLALLPIFGVISHDEQSYPSLQPKLILKE